jgi:hypothetical protein
MQQPLFMMVVHGFSTFVPSKTTTRVPVGNGLLLRLGAFQTNDDCTVVRNMPMHRNKGPTTAPTTMPKPAPDMIKDLVQTQKCYSTESGAILFGKMCALECCV